MKRLLCLCFVFASLLVSGSVHAGERVALVIGISKYRSIPSLENPSRDAASVAAALRKSGFEVTELTAANATDRRGVGTAIARFRAKADSAEAAVIYYAGHGVEDKGSNWLLPSDASAATPEDLAVTGIPSSLMIGAVKGAKEVRLVILDACRDNPFLTEPGWSKGTRGGIAQRGLARDMSRPDNVVVLLATQPGLAANDAGRASAGNSPFARALSSTLVRPGLRLAELPSRIAAQMRASDGLDQRPDQQGIFDSPLWLFVPDRAAKPPVSKLAAASPAQKAGGLEGLVDCIRFTTTALDPAGPPNLKPVPDQLLNPGLAVPACQSALAAMPEEGFALFGLGRAERKLGNEQAAFDYFRQAAAAGSAEAAYELGVQLQTHAKSPDDLANAYLHFETAAVAGHKPAMIRMADALWDGRGVPMGKVMAYFWYEKAGDFAFEKGRHLLRLAAGYETGQAGSKDMALAARYYGQANAMDNPDAAWALGFLEAEGLGVVKDPIRALQLFERAAELGHARAAGVVGWQYSLGIDGRPIDLDKAFRFATKAADLGEAMGIRVLADLYRRGAGTPRDEDRAMMLLMSGAMLEHRDIADTLLRELAQGVGSDLVHRQLFEDVQPAARAGKPWAMTALGLMYETGRGTLQDRPEAVVWYEKAARAGYAEAMRRLGDAHRLGKGVPTDYMTALRWYESPELSENPEAQRGIGAIYYAGGNGVAANMTKARIAFEAVGNLDADAEGSYALARIYDEGLDTPENPAKARARYLDAAKLDHIEAMDRLITMLKKGQGGPKMSDEAKIWKQKLKELKKD